MENNQDSFSIHIGENAIIIESITVKLSVLDDNGYSAVVTTRQMAKKAGFNEIDEVLIATAASELATNILRYAKCGELIISIVREVTNGKTGIEILACDEGPGIKNLKLAMQEQYSSLPDSLGLGLPSVKRIMDDFNIETFIGKGTRVLARKWKR